MGPDALDWHNWFGPSKNLDKTCLCWIFNVSSMWALRHGKIFVGHKCQSHGLINNIACALFAGKVTCVSRVMGSWWSLTSSIERVALAYYCLCSSFFLFLQFVQLQQRQLPLLLCHWRLHHVRLQLVLDYHNRFVRRRWRTPHPYYWNLSRPCNSWCNIPEEFFYRQMWMSRETFDTDNFGGLRTEILRLNIEIIFSWLTRFSFKPWR